MIKRFGEGVVARVGPAQVAVVWHNWLLACLERLMRPRVAGSSGFEAAGAGGHGGPVNAAGGIARVL